VYSKLSLLQAYEFGLKGRQLNSLRASLLWGGSWMRSHCILSAQIIEPIDTTGTKDLAVCLAQVFRVYHEGITIMGKVMSI
jgi:hypothetical protein